MVIYSYQLYLHQFLTSSVLVTVRTGDVHKTLSYMRPRRDRDVQPSRLKLDRDVPFSNSRDRDETFHFRERDPFETFLISNYRKQLTEASHQNY